MPLTSSYRYTMRRWRIQAKGLFMLPWGSNALKGHNATKLPEFDIELLDFRSKIAVVMTSNFAH